LLDELLPLSEQAGMRIGARLQSRFHEPVARSPDTVNGVAPALVRSPDPLRMSDCERVRRAALPAICAAILTLEPVEGGTRYTARVMHANAAQAAEHAAMGFAEGWGAALDQLIAHMKSVS
jgi:uncharacterized protein YndB with AHSA1/START domain